jgi:hypothetical protein
VKTLSLTHLQMCTQDYRVYTCGCKKDEEYRQCAAKFGTNEICTPMVKNKLESATHMCITHMVPAGKDKMSK